MKQNQFDEAQPSHIPTTETGNVTLDAAQTKLNRAVMYALKEGCFFPVPEPRKGASVLELIQWGAMRNLHDAIADFNRVANGQVTCDTRDNNRTNNSPASNPKSSSTPSSESSRVIAERYFALISKDSSADVVGILEQLVNLVRLESSSTPRDTEVVAREVWDEAIAIVKGLQDDYLATAVELERQSGNADGTDVFTGNASVTMEVIEALEAARDRTASPEVARIPYGAHYFESDDGSDKCVGEYGVLICGLPESDHIHHYVSPDEVVAEEDQETG